jgi:hypothetical protein
MTITRSPGPIPARRLTCSGVAMASGIAVASIGEMPAGTGSRLNAGNTQNSA